LYVYAFTAFFLGLGFIAFWGRSQYLPLIFGSGVLVVLLVAGRLNFSREWFAVGRMLGNSMNLRAEIQYALAHTQWLAMEGARSQSIGDLCEDTAFIASKLGYDSMHIRLEDGERTWRFRLVNEDGLYLFRHQLPGHRDCFIELGVLCPKGSGDTEFLRANARQKFCMSCLKTKDLTSPADNGAFVSKTCSILSDLVAEGWAKAIVAGEKQNQLPVRFGVRPAAPAPAPEKQPGKSPVVQIAKI
jgi:hypothetical protein